MGDNKRNMVVEDGIKEMVKKGMSIANFVKCGLKGKEMPKLFQYQLENPLNSKDMVIILKNPTEVIVKNRNFLLDLIKYGFDEKEMPKLFQYYHGLCSYTGGMGIDKLWREEFSGWWKAENFKEDTAVGIWKFLKYWESDNSVMKAAMEIPDKKFRKDVDYGIRTLSSLCKNPVITDETKKQLAKERSHLLRVKKFFSFSSPRLEEPIHPDEKDVMFKAKSWKQMRGFQVIKAYNYIKPFMKKINDEEYTHEKDYLEKDIFSLICEFLKQLKNEFGEYIVDDIKNLYFNNISYSSKV